MKRSFIIQFLGVVAILLSALSCNKQRALTDEELAVVFRDAFLSNAYTTTNKLNLDSLRLYEPIFQKYGYTTADVQYTIGSFATRKSARLSDVVERAIDMLEEVGEVLDFEVSILDTIDNIAIRRTQLTQYSDSLIQMRSLRDTTKFIITLEDLTPGDYIYRFDYYIDSLDTFKGSYQTRSWIEDRSEELKKGEKRARLRLRNAILTRNNIAKHENNFTIEDTTQVAVLTLASLPNTSGTPHLTIKNLSVYNKFSNEQARDSLFKQLFKVRIFDDELLF